MRGTEEPWGFEVERGPDWLFVKLIPPAGVRTSECQLGSQVWGLLQQHMAHRVVIEMDNVRTLPNNLVDELLMLRHLVDDHQGMLRLSGLSDRCQKALQKRQGEAKLPHYGSRGEAIFAGRMAGAKHEQLATGAL